MDQLIPSSCERNGMMQTGSESRASSDEYLALSVGRGNVDMKGKRYSEEKIIDILREHAAGLSAKEIIKRYGIANGTFYRWRARYQVDSEVQKERMNQLEFENDRLKKMLADTLLEKFVLEEELSGNKKLTD